MEEIVTASLCTHDRLITLKRPKREFIENKGHDSTLIREFVIERTVCVACGLMLREQTVLVGEQIYVHDIIEG